MPDGVSYEGIFGEGESPAQFQTLGKSGRAAGAVPMSSRALSDRSQPMRQEAPALQPREVAADESRKPASEPEVDKDVASKLAPELRGLAAKVRNGNYTEGAVKVRNGVIQVHVKVALMDAATAKALRDVGARIVAEMHSDKTFYVAIPVEALDRLAALEGVLRVEPPTS
jgi:hypothetical protein